MLLLDICCDLLLHNIALRDVAHDCKRCTEVTGVLPADRNPECNFGAVGEDSAKGRVCVPYKADTCGSLNQPICEGALHYPLSDVVAQKPAVCLLLVIPSPQK